MSFEWTTIPPETALHPRLEPVSAWLFEADSAFLRTGNAAQDAARLYSMPIAANGFNPSFGPVWRALSVPNPRGTDASAANEFTLIELASEVSAQSEVTEDARVYVVPLPQGSMMPAPDLLRRMHLGTPRRDRPNRPLEAPKAIVGIIDHGINFLHHRFRRGDTSSRVAYAWDQSAHRHNDRLPFGREWLLADIENALEDAAGDEDALLRAIGGDVAQPGFHPLGYRASHGTHVLDLAAGFEPQDTEGHAVPIISVTLPPEVTRETTGSMLALPFCLGLEYIADRARHVFYDTGEVVPVFVNFSFGLTGGPRGGLHRLEQTIAAVAAHHQSKTQEIFPDAVAPFSVVCAAGNNNLAQGHARNTQAVDRIDLRWQIQPVDTTANILEMRVELPETSAGGVVDLTLSVSPPGQDDAQDTLISIADGRDVSTLRWLRKNGSVIGRLSAWRDDTRFVTLTLALAPTDPGPNGDRAAPSGIWMVSLRCQSQTPDRIDAWILRDDVPGGFRDTGRQSYFVDEAYQRRDVRGFVVAEDVETGSVVQRSGSLNAIATADRPAADLNSPEQAQIWVIGAAERKHGHPQSPLKGATDYSAHPLSDTAERVDASALGDMSSVTRGILAAGTRPGSKVVLSGTSVAAPQVVRYFATGDGAVLDPPEDASSRIGPVIETTPALR